MDSMEVIRLDEENAQDKQSTHGESRDEITLLERQRHANGGPPQRIPNRSLTFLDGFAIIVGIIIGSGIFSSPGVALERSGSPGAALLAWACAGALVCLTSQCYFELGCMFPTAGGDYDYLQKAYGDRVAFSFAWFNFFISKPGSQAIIATIFGRYCETVFTGQSTFGHPGQNGETAVTKLIAALVLAVITGVNCIGLKESALLQIILTFTKLGLVVLLFIVAIARSSKDTAVIAANLSPQFAFRGSNGIFDFGSAMIACLWSYDGWCDLNFLMEDLAEPQKTLPRVVLSSLAVVTVAYVLANVAYFAVLSRDQIETSPAVAFDLGIAVVAPSRSMVLASAFAVGVALSALGSVNGSIMSGGRAFFAVARDGKAPACLARENAAGAPWAALLAQGGWGIFLVLLPQSSFSTLLDYFGPASWFFYALTSSAVVALRRQHPARIRPYSIPLYPLPVVLVVLIASVVIVSAFMTEPMFTCLAFGFIALSAPAHLALEWWGSRAGAVTGSRAGEGEDGARTEDGERGVGLDVDDSTHTVRGLGGRQRLGHSALPTTED